MTVPVPKEISTTSLFVWLMHQIGDTFKEHAILKGGMSLMLANCPRNTNDIDYIFVPYTSKKEIEGDLEKIVRQIPNAKIIKSVNSKSINFKIVVGKVSFQVEASVSDHCKSIPMSTGAIASRVNELGKIIKIMSFDVALSHKLAAWNERRLLRDLYDVYYIYEIIGENPDIDTLKSRLQNIESRIPKYRSIKKMSVDEFKHVLSEEIAKIDSNKIRELSPILGNEDIQGLDIKIKVAIRKLLAKLDVE